MTVNIHTCEHTQICTYMLVFRVCFQGNLWLCLTVRGRIKPHRGQPQGVLPLSTWFEKEYLGLLAEVCPILAGLQVSGGSPVLTSHYKHWIWGRTSCCYCVQIYVGSRSSHLIWQVFYPWSHLSSLLVNNYSYIRLSSNSLERSRDTCYLFIVASTGTCECKAMTLTRLRSSRNGG